VRKEGSLLAILGRGIQKTTPDGPWLPTEDLEVYGEDGAHRTIRVQADDENPKCLVGGGELNLRAGIELYKKLDQRVVVCAYGHRAEYLKKIGGPSESEVLSTLFAAEVKKVIGVTPTVDVWLRTREVEGKSNTNTELKNIFELAVGLGLGGVTVATVSVHIPRVLLLAERHISSVSQFKNLELQFFSSEEVLLDSEPQEYWDERIRRMHGSKAHLRALHLEMNGVRAIIDGTYGKIWSEAYQRS